MASIDDLSIYDDSDDRYISTNSIEDIWYGNQIHPELNTRDDRLKIRDCIKQTKSGWKGSELSANSMGKGLHKLFKTVVNELNNTLHI